MKTRFSFLGLTSNDFLYATGAAKKLVALLLLLLATLVQAEDFTYTINNGTITITKYTGAGGEVIIPSTINGLPVTSIGQSAFVTYPPMDPPYSTNVISVVIPDSVTTIGERTFMGCAGLTNVAIPNSVTSIGELAFAACTGLSSITIPNTLVSIEFGAFIACKSLTDVTIPNSVVSIGERAFDGCFRLTRITIPNSMTTIDERAFSDCTGLTNVAIPNSVTNIGDWAFSGTSLTSVIIPDGVTSIGNGAFDDCFGLTNVTIGNGVTSIGDQAFAGFFSLARVTIPASVTSIGDGALVRCSQDEIHGTRCASPDAIYFLGNAPATPSSAFGNAGNGIVYYLPGTAGWGTTFGGLPTALWLPQAQTADPSFGIRTNQFGFTINWASDKVVVVEATPDLAQPVWVPVSTNMLTGGASYFSDPAWTTNPSRFYRLRSP